MSLSNTAKIIIAVVIVLLVGGAGYYFYTRGGGAVVADLSAAQSGVIDQSALILVEKVNSISIDPSLFSDTIFVSLHDYSIPLQDEERGRPNPFAPIGSENSKTGTKSGGKAF